MQKHKKYRVLILTSLIFFMSLGIVYIHNNSASAQNIFFPKEVQNEILQASGLYIDGKLFAVLPTPDDVQETLSLYKDQLLTPSDNKDISSSEYVEQVEIQQVEADRYEIKATDEVLQDLLEGKSSTINYVVEKDDSIWLIAKKNGISTKDILSSNPGLEEDSQLPEGETIKVTKKEPYINVISHGSLVINEVIPFEVDTAYDPELRPGASVIKDLGQDGEAKVFYSFAEKNGKLISKKIIKKEILSEPSKQIIYQGPAKVSSESNKLPASYGSGKVSSFIWPLNGSITSYYGNRHGEFHTGIDIAGETGQPYVAAADGTVLQASWQGNYGNTLLLDHGNGVVTRYAHSLKLLVKPGQNVTKGQIIGYVGSTGRSTGPHLHLELIINGQLTNPLNHLETPNN